MEEGDSQSNNINEHKEHGHSEFELTFVLIMIGLLGIAFFAWYVGSNNRVVVIEPVFFTEEKSVQNISEFKNPDDVVNRDPNILGLRIDTVLGKFFVHPKTGATLYTTSKVCDGECLSNWTPYVNKLRRQYAWKGQPLYTYNLDSEESALGDDVDGVWKIARP